MNTIQLLMIIVISQKDVEVVNLVKLATEFCKMPLTSRFWITLLDNKDYVKKLSQLAKLSILLVKIMGNITKNFLFKI